MLAAAPDEISAEQRAALANGVTTGEITFEVYQDAVLATIALFRFRIGMLWVLAGGAALGGAGTERRYAWKPLSFSP